MTTPDDFDDSALDDLVLGSAVPRSADRLRRELREDTARVIRTRRRVRRVATACGFVVCYVAGLLTMQLFGQQPRIGENPAPIIVADRDPPPPEPAAEPTIDSAGEHNVTNPPPAMAIVEEQPRPHPAEATPATSARRPEIRHSRFEALRELGDRYLLERQDPEGALRAYRLALRSATPIERMLAQDEGTWLFRALTRDYERENSDERHDG